MPSKNRKNLDKNRERFLDNLTVKAQKDAQDQIMSDVNAVGVDENEMVIYDDGDQSKVAGVYQSENLQNLWSSGRDWYARITHLSKFGIACATGSYKEIEATINAVEDNKDELHKLLEKRETKMRFNSLLHLISGARCGIKPVIKFDPNLEQDYIKSIKLLINAGVNINAKDFAGFTPLMHCFTCYGNHLTRQLGEILMEAGANINEQNRIGATVLFEPTMSNNYEICKFLLDHGADPTIKEYTSGCSPFSLCKLYPSILSLYGSHITKLNTDKESKCARCSAASTKRCGRCLKAFYCTKECQTVDWPVHRLHCKTASDVENQLKQQSTISDENNNLNDSNIAKLDLDKLKLGRSKDKYCSLVKMNSGEVSGGKVDRNSVIKAAADLNKVKKFILKIQAPLIGMREALIAYNKDRSLQFRYTENFDKYDQIYKKIRTEGIMGAKGFFAAWINDGNTHLYIDVDEILPPESW